LPSLHDGTPLTLIEGMANARPFLSTAVGGVVDLAGEVDANAGAEPGYSVCERGVLAGSGDVEGLCLGLKRLIDDEALRRTLGKRGLGFVRANYSRDRLLDGMALLWAGR